MDSESAKLALLEREISVKERDLEHRIFESKVSAWRSPLVVAVMVAALGAFSNAWITYYNAYLAREAALVEFDRTNRLASTEAENARILEMIKIGEPDQVKRNLQFLIETSLVSNTDVVSDIKEYYAHNAPGTGPGASHPSKNVNTSRSKLFNPGEIITYSFTRTPSLDERTLIESSMREWEKYANIKFEYRENLNDAVIRIGLDRSASSWAFIGRDALNVAAPAPNLNISSNNRREVLSEIGHVLGFPNEHQNPQGKLEWNERALVEYYSRHEWSLAQIQHRFFSKSSIYPCSRSFDPNSIMMEQLPDSIFKVSFPRVVSDNLSESDKLCAAEMYPFEAPVKE